ncbi:hypothetical protein ACF8OI_17455 [Aeromonas bivalvium]|uniref:hypothetical protein n=1 Tax=Aeromonas bivalvium TaxID=440079 RepID=UPI00370BC6FB
MQASEFFPAPVVKVLEAIQRGDEAAARRQIEQGVNLNIQGEEGLTPLLWLVYETKDHKIIKRSSLLSRLVPTPTIRMGLVKILSALLLVPSFPNCWKRY